VLCLTFISCNQEFTSHKKVWLETNSQTIYDASKYKLFTGKIQGKEDGNTFYGNVINGKPDGICYWLNTSNDTIQVLKFKDGERVFSQQFNENNQKRGNAWTMQVAEATNSDQELVSKTLQILFKGNPDLIKDFYNPSGSFSELTIVKSSIKKIKADYGNIRTIKTQDIEKRKYGHSPEFHLNTPFVLTTDKGEVKCSIRMHVNNGIITSMGVRKVPAVTPNNFVKPDFYFFLKL
jgi:hypothetical protein